MQPDPVVLCMRWGKSFPPDYVNVLFRATTSHLKRRFNFVCLTDDPRGLDSRISTLPIPDIGLTEAQILSPGVWRKLALFHPDIAAISPGARALFIDLDMMILGNLENFLVPTTKMILLDTGRDWQSHQPVQPSTGIFSFNLGEQFGILNSFLTDPSAAMSRFRNEQDFVASECEDLSLWPSGSVISFKRHLVHRYGRDLFFAPRCPPRGPAIVAFHGQPRPSDLLNFGIWGRFPHIGLGPVSWARDYWLAYGGGLTR